MKRLIPILLLCLIAACDKAELPVDNPPSPPTQQPGGNEGGGDEGEEGGDAPIGGGDYTVAQAQQLVEGEYVVISAYIVGYVTGSALNEQSCHFECPVDKANTNFLLADSPTCTTPAQCMPVMLENTGTYATRAELNLYDNPDLLGMPIRIEGSIASYFRTNGIKRIISYELLDEIQPPTEPDEPSDPSDPSVPEEPDEPSDPEEPEDPSTPEPPAKPDTPDISPTLPDTPIDGRAPKLRRTLTK